jgi:hypothetical protein
MTRMRLKNGAAKAKVAGSVAALTMGASLIAAVNPFATGQGDPGR